MWRTLGNQTYPSPDPSVFEVKVKTPEDVELLLQKEKASDFIIYLNRRRTDVQLKYPEFFKKYAWSYKKPAKYNDLTCYTIQIPRIAKPIYISQRDSNRWSGRHHQNGYAISYSGAEKFGIRDSSYNSLSNVSRSCSCLCIGNWSKWGYYVLHGHSLYIYTFGKRSLFLVLALQVTFT